MTAMTVNQATITDPWPGLDAVPLTAVAQAADLTMRQVRRVEQEGLVVPLDRRGPNGRFLLDKEDALLLLRAAIAAAVIGVALSTAIRFLRNMPEVVSMAA